MTITIDIIVNGSIISYTKGSGGVSNIQVKYYFANVVDVYIHFDDHSYKRYLQCPCIFSYTP